jgi:hypothetical protein
MFNTTQDFFKKRGVPVMTVTDLFNFVIDQSISDEDVDDYLEKVFLSECATLSLSLSLYKSYRHKSG